MSARVHHSREWSFVCMHLPIAHTAKFRTSCSPVVGCGLGFGDLGINSSCLSSFARLSYREKDQKFYHERQRKIALTLAWECLPDKRDICRRKTLIMPCFYCQKPIQAVRFAVLSELLRWMEIFSWHQSAISSYLEEYNWFDASCSASFVPLCADILGILLSQTKMYRRDRLAVRVQQSVFAFAF